MLGFSTTYVFKDYSDAVDICKGLEEHNYELYDKFSYDGNSAFVYKNWDTNKLVAVVYGESAYNKACEDVYNVRGV